MLAHPIFLFGVESPTQTMSAPLALICSTAAPILVGGHRAKRRAARASDASQGERPLKDFVASRSATPLAPP